jgi:hypothetical protein
MILPLRTSPKSAPEFPESAPDFAKSAQPPKSGICLLPSRFNDLGGTFQISEATFRNLLRNLESINDYSCLEQISDFGFSSLKGRCHPLKRGVTPSRGPVWFDDG